MQKAKERGVHFGPKKKLPPEQIVELQQRREQGTRITTLMYDYGISKVSVYRYLSQTAASLSTENGLCRDSLREVKPVRRTRRQRQS